MSVAGDQLFSISRLAELTTLDRATVRKRLEGVEPSAGAKNAKLYSLGAALPALIAGASAEMDEAKLRKVRNEAELREMAVLRERGELLPSAEVESQRVKENQWLYTRLTSNYPREAAERLYKAESPEQIAGILRHDMGRLLNEWRDI